MTEETGTLVRYRLDRAKVRQSLTHLQLMREVYGWFTEGFDSAERQEA